MQYALTLAAAWLTLATATGLAIGRALAYADRRCYCGGCPR